MKQILTSTTVSTAAFRDRNVAVLEALVEHLIERGHSYREVAVLLHRDERTIWTTFARVAKKRNKQE